MSGGAGRGVDSARQPDDASALGGRRAAAKARPEPPRPPRGPSPRSARSWALPNL